jgi:peptide-methionine (R)-S-oxide reductase
MGTGEVAPITGPPYARRNLSYDERSEMKTKIEKTDSEWREQLTPEQYEVTREAGTEGAFTGPYVDEKTAGMYHCVCCGTELFSSDTKFDSGTGWPSFTEPANLEHVELRPDNSLFMRRTEVVCKHCDAHLGHVFEDGPPERGGQRYCINGCALELKPAADEPTPTAES